MTRRWLAAALAACAALSTILAAGASATAPAALTLAGTTTVVAPAGSARISVVVPHDVVLRQLTPSPDVRVDGTADAAAVYLIPSTRPLLKEPAYFGRFPKSLGGITQGNGLGGLDRVPAGRYSLVIVHSRGTAAVTFQLPGLKGRTTLRPRQPSTAALSLLTAAAPTAVGYPNVGSVGPAMGKLSGTGFVQVAAQVDSAAAGLTHIAMCLAAPGDIPPTAMGFAPDCTGDHGAADNAVGGGQTEASSFFLNWGAGTYAGGYTFAGSSLPQQTGGWVAWVPLDH